MTKANYAKLAYFDGSYGHLTTVSQEGFAHEIVTTRAHPDHYIRVGDGRQYRQLCAGGGYRGATLVWAKDEARMGRQFAKDCGARFFKTRENYKQAVADLCEANRSMYEAAMQALA